MLRIPVLASVGHHTDRTLLDDVAAVSCSTPTHAAEVAVQIHCGQARSQLATAAHRLQADGKKALLSRARSLTLLCKAPSEHIRRQRSSLHQQLREARAAARRRISQERSLTLRRLTGIASKADGALHDSRKKRPAELARLALALEAHDPQRTLRRGYALVQAGDGQPVTNAEQAYRAREVVLRFADSSVEAEVRTDR